MVISVVQLGTVAYSTGLNLQAELLAARKDNRIPDTLLLLQHKPVITLGRNANLQNVLLSRELLQNKGVELFETDRGGDVTFHGPGQLVGYPIFDLHGFPSTGGALKYLGAVDYVRKVEELLIRTCLEYGVPTKRISGLTGVWTDWNEGRWPSEVTGSCTGRNGSRSPSSDQSPDHLVTQSLHAKIAAIGVHISRSVTSHGFALNVNTDLDYFKLIVPCGISDKPVTSLQQELDRDLDLDEVAQRVSRNFGRVFDRQMLPVNTIDELLGRSVEIPAKAPEDLRRLREDDASWA